MRSIPILFLLACLALLVESQPLFLRPNVDSIEKRQLKQFNPRAQPVLDARDADKHQPSKRAESGHPKPSKRAVSIPFQIFLRQSYYVRYFNHKK